MTPAETIAAGRAVLGVEFGSTRIKACLVGDDPTVVLATGSCSWENTLRDGRWTYPLPDVWRGLQAAYADLTAAVRRDHGVPVRSLRAVGVSAMMHGYLPFDAQGELLVPFRTWRNTSTGQAAAQLTTLFGQNIPQRWSIAHLHQAILDGEPHVARIGSVTTLAGYVHEQLTGRRVLGVGDASGMFPIGPDGRDYDPVLIDRYQASGAFAATGLSLRGILPAVLPAGADAGTLTAAGAGLLDPTGTLQPGAVMCPPEGDAGTGMVATGAVAPRQGNVSAGTSVFAMVVLERPLAGVHEQIDLVATPAGAPVAMVHCNNGASELGAWAGLFARFAQAAGLPVDSDRAFEVLFGEAAGAEPDAGGLVAYNHLAGEPVLGTTAGRPLFVRTPDSRFTLANVMRAQLYGVFATLALGMRTLADENVHVDRMFAHGGLFRTAGVAQRTLAAALDVPVAVGRTASEGGAWGAAVLAAYTADRAGAASDDVGLASYLATRVFAHADVDTARPDPADVAGFTAYLHRYQAGLPIEHAATHAI